MAPQLCKQLLSYCPMQCMQVCKDTCIDALTQSALVTVHAVATCSVSSMVVTSSQVHSNVGNKQKCCMTVVCQQQQKSERQFLPRNGESSRCSCPNGWQLLGQLLGGNMHYSRAIQYKHKKFGAWEGGCHGTCCCKCNVCFIIKLSHSLLIMLMCTHCNLFRQYAMSWLHSRLLQPAVVFSNSK